jgi:hypothetical protein
MFTAPKNRPENLRDVVVAVVPDHCDAQPCKRFLLASEVEALEIANHTNDPVVDGWSIQRRNRPLVVTEFDCAARLYWSSESTISSASELLPLRSGTKPCTW